MVVRVTCLKCRPSLWNNYTLSGQALLNSLMRIKSCFDRTKITGALPEDPLKFMISRRFVFGLRKFSDKNCRENQHTHFVSYEIITSGRQQTVWCHVDTIYMPGNSRQKYKHAVRYLIVTAL